MEENENEVRDPAALLAAYNKSKEDLLTLREKLKGLEQKQKELNEDTFRLKALAAETKLALHNRGFKDAERLMPYVGTEGLDLAEDGSVAGLDERLAVLKKDLPEVFDPKVRAGGKADIFADSAVDEKRNPLRDAVHKALS